MIFWSTEFNWIYAFFTLSGWLVKNLPTTQEIQETWVQLLCQEDPSLEKKFATTPVFLQTPYRQRRLLGYSPWGCEVRKRLSKAAQHGTEARTANMQWAVSQQWRKYWLRDDFLFTLVHSTLWWGQAEATSPRRHFLHTGGSSKTSANWGFWWYSNQIWKMNLKNASFSGIFCVCIYPARGMPRGTL